MTSGMVTRFFICAEALVDIVQAIVDIPNTPV
jgi:hypothetical protein